MKQLKCETCGAPLQLDESGTHSTCTVCGNVYEYRTPKEDYYIEQLSEAHDMRMRMDFDDAAAKYRFILKNIPEDAEAYWGLMLSEYGIGYEQDITHAYVPTFHRNKRGNILESDAYKCAIEYATDKQRLRYIRAGEQLRNIQKSIEDYARTAEHFDVFLSFKATDLNAYGMPEKTIDRDIAYNIYDELSSHGVKVFFSEVTLKDMASADYESVIFHALNTSRVFILVGTSSENINSVWVKNEWSRYTERYIDDKKYGNATSSHFAVLGGSLVQDDLPEIFKRTQNVMLSGYAGEGYKKDIAASVYKILDVSPTGGDIADNKDLRPCESLVYSLNDDFKSYSVTGCGMLSSDSIIIPSIHDGLPVTRVGEGVFKCKRRVRLIRMPSTVKTIEKEAFYGLDITSIILPEGLESIGDNAFESCESLTEINIPSSVRSIGEWAFLRCTGVKSLRIEDNSRLESIGKGAFESCIKLENVYVSSNVVLPKKSIWGTCVSIRDVIAPASVVQGMPRNAIRNVSINGGESLGAHVFENCNNLKKITFAEGIRSIGGFAFLFCSKLEEVALPSTLECIGESAFFGCSALREVVLGANMKKIEKFAFNGCLALRTVNIPIGVTEVGELAFNTNKNCIVNVEATEKPKTWHKNWKSDKLMGRKKNVVFGAK